MPKKIHHHLPPTNQLGSACKNSDHEQHSCNSIMRPNTCIWRLWMILTYDQMGVVLPLPWAFLAIADLVSNPWPWTCRQVTTKNRFMAKKNQLCATQSSKRDSTNTNPAALHTPARTTTTHHHCHSPFIFSYHYYYTQHEPQIDSAMLRSYEQTAVWTYPELPNTFQSKRFTIICLFFHRDCNSISSTTQGHRKKERKKTQLVWPSECSEHDLQTAWGHSPLHRDALQVPGHATSQALRKNNNSSIPSLEYTLCCIQTLSQVVLSYQQQPTPPTLRKQTACVPLLVTAHLLHTAQVWYGTPNHCAFIRNSPAWYHSNHCPYM